MAEQLTRRVFLTTIATTGAVMGTVALAACGKKETALDCTDVSSLSEADKKAREGVKYVDKSEMDGKNCANCMQYEPKGENECGACKVVKGPIHPKGYCTIWVKKAG